MKNITIHPQATIKEAMEALDKTAEKVLLVVDEKQVLIGTLTDGDIRRHILKGHNLSGTIQDAFHLNPIFIFQDDFDPDKIKAVFLKKKIDLIPILNQDRKVVDFKTWEKAFGNNKRSKNQKLDVPVVIMAGGRGSRLEPFTRVLPKPLIPVGDKPVIDHIIDRFRAYGVYEFYLTIHHKSKILRAYFEEKSPDYSIGFAEEDEPRGTAGSLKLLADKLNKPFFVSNCDIIIEADYADIFHFHTKNSYDITLVASTKQYNIPYGICELNGGGSLERIKEKPEYNFLVNTGLYVLNSDIIDLIPEDKLFHITHLMDKVRENKGTVGVYPVSEKAWIDVGQWAEYRNALKVIEGISS
jgi:dTDP-glucose pyrophosphorylase/CBS domain-containing protein